MKNSLVIRTIDGDTYHPAYSPFYEIFEEGTCKKIGSAHLNSMEDVIIYFVNKNVGPLVFFYDSTFCNAEVIQKSMIKSINIFPTSTT